MRKLACLSLAALAVVLAPRPARAEGPPPEAIRVYCQPGSLNNCFAFAIVSEDGRYTYWLQNLQGSIEPGGTTFDIGDIWIQNAGHAGQLATFMYRETTPTGAPVGSGCQIFSIEGAVRRGAECFAWDSNALPYEQRRYILFTRDGLVGCTEGRFIGGQFVAQTCLPQGLNGWLRADATGRVVNTPGPDRPGTIEDLFITIAGCNVVVGSSSGFTQPATCATNLSYADIVRGTVVTVPEPTSIALLAGGLLGTGVAGAARSRRRRG